MEEVSPSLSAITLNVNTLNSSIMAEFWKLNLKRKKKHGFI
jgi:hypothetical protein